MVKKSELIGKEVYRIRNPEGRVMYSFIIDEGEKVIGERKLTENLWNRLNIEGQTRYLKQEYNQMRRLKKVV